MQATARNGYGVLPQPFMYARYPLSSRRPSSTLTRKVLLAVGQQKSHRLPSSAYTSANGMLRSSSFPALKMSNAPNVPAVPSHVILAKTQVACGLVFSTSIITVASSSRCQPIHIATDAFHPKGINAQI